MSEVDDLTPRYIPKIFVVCDRPDTAPVWGYILRQQGLTVILEPSINRALDRWSVEEPDLGVIDVDAAHRDRLDLYQKFRGVSTAPVLLFLPVHHETQILEAYAAGVDDVVVKPISPAIFLAKIMAWARRSQMIPTKGLHPAKAGKYQLDPDRRCIPDPNGKEIKLTNLEFRLLRLLMSQPGHLFGTEDIIQALWGGPGGGDQGLVKNVVYRLRKKIEADRKHPSLLRTGPGGYSFHG